jgi:hypothetical protein
VRRIQQFFRLDTPRPPRPRLDLGPGLDDQGVREHTR